MLTQVVIGGADRSTNTLRVEVWRTINSVGRWMVVLRNTAGVYNNTFDVQNQFLIDVNGFANTLMQGRVDGPAVTLSGNDLESIWDEYVVVRGVDQAQDLLFHNDFEHDYPVITQQIKTVLNDIFNVQLMGLTNITYVMPGGATPVIGPVEFREGAGFLGTLQEAFRRAPWIFYVDDVLALQSGAPGFSASGVILNSVAGDVTNNILGVTELQERDGDKLYNYVKLYGKNPMFDGYTEQNAVGWTFFPVGNGADDTNIVRVGTYSVVGWGSNPVVIGQPTLSLTLPTFNYATYDFSKGELGVWARYDNTAAAPGTPGAGGAASPDYLFCVLTDGGGITAGYFGASTLLYINEWGYCTFPLGEAGSFKAATINEWFFNAPGFDWGNVVNVEFSLRTAVALDDPSHLYLDGISIPLPCIAIIENIPSQTAYRKRPYIDSFSHIRTQSALQEEAASFLPHHDATGIERIRLTTPGNRSLRYAGQTVTINIPALGLNNAVFYMTEIHHVIEPYQDVSEGYGFDWITEVEAVPIAGIPYDMSRLSDRAPYSAAQTALRAGMGLRGK